jgi:hypothetical protein
VVFLVALRLALEDHELGLEEVLETLVDALAADAGLLVPAEAHAEVGAHRVVAHGAGTQPPGDLAGPVDVVGEHRGVEPVDGVVGDPHRVILVGGRDDRQHWAEDLLLGDDGVVVDVAEHRRLDVPAAVEVLGAPAAGGEGRAVGDALGDVALDPVPLPFRRQRPLGGMKDSGWGRSGPASIHDFTEIQWITTREGTGHFPI